MKKTIAFFLLFAAGCTQAELHTSDDQQGLVLTTNPLPSTYSAFPITDWSPTMGFRWPAGASRMQVTVRTGEVDEAGAVTTFYAFVIADGSRLDRVLRGRVGDYARFREVMIGAITTTDVPGASRTWGINGGLYTGPRIGVGPAGGDPPVEVPGAYVARIMRSAGSIEDATMLSNSVSVPGM